MGLVRCEQRKGPVDPGYLLMAIETLSCNNSLRLSQHGSAQLQTLRTRRVSSQELLSRMVPIPGVSHCTQPCRGTLSFASPEHSLMASGRRVHGRASPAPCEPLSCYVTRGS